MLLQEAHRAVEIIWTNFNPLTIHAQQRRALTSESLKCIDRERLVAQRDLPRVIDEAVQSKVAAFTIGAVAATWRNHAVAAVDQQTRAEAACRLSPPTWRKHHETRLHENRAEIAEKCVGFGG